MSKLTAATLAVTIVLVSMACLYDLAFNGVTYNSREFRVATDFQALSNMILTYELNARHPPSTQQGLSALITKPTLPPEPRRWVQITTSLPGDPWGNPYAYRLDIDSGGKWVCEVRSAGEDGMLGTKDDFSQIFETRTKARLEQSAKADVPSF